MPYDPRTIAFLCELVHPPQTPDPRAIQRLHNALFASGDPLYKSFHVTHEGATLSNPVSNPGASSSVQFAADRIRFREELSGLTAEEFARRVVDIAAQAVELTGLQLFTAQQVTVRSLVNPRHFGDSRKFLRDGLFGFDDEVETFGREPQLYGMRLVFPPAPERPNAHALRIESFHTDPRSVFLEDQGSFGPTVVAHGLDGLRANVEETYAFVVERAAAFLARFDVHQEA